MPRLNPPTPPGATLSDFAERIRRMVGLLVLGQTAWFYRCFAPQLRTMLAVASSDRTDEALRPLATHRQPHHPHWPRER